MKKYLLGLFAMVIAIGFSAFTPQKKIVKNSWETPLIWYTIDTDGSLGVAYDGTTEYTKSEVVTLCEDQDDIDCMRGYDTEQFDFVNSAPGVSEEDEHIRKSF